MISQVTIGKHAYITQNKNSYIIPTIEMLQPFAKTLKDLKT
jgi:hypothetical protein